MIHQMSWVYRVSVLGGGLRLRNPTWILVVWLFKNLGGGGEIRTHGTLRYDGFQDRCVRPLCHPSVIYSRGDDPTPGSSEIEVGRNQTRYTNSRIPIVLITSRAMNHFHWPARAACHRAKPLIIKVQSATRRMKGRRAIKSSGANGE